MIYRVYNDYPRAMACLGRTYSFKFNQPLEIEIANMTMLWADQSPLGAAFDCKLAIRMYLHHRKWAKGSDRWLSDKSMVNTSLAVTIQQNIMKLGGRSDLA